MKIPSSAFLFFLFTAFPLSAQTGSHQLFGFPCTGTGDRPGPPCIKSNDIYKAGAVALFTGNVYAIRATTGTKACTVTGFELQHATRAGRPVWIRTWLYSANAKGEPDKVLARGIMVVDKALSWYGTSFKPVTIPAKTHFFLAYDCPSQARLAPASIAQLGNKVPCFRMRSGKWSPMPAVKWIYRVNAGRAAGGGKPLLTAAAPPALGKVFTAQVHYVPLVPPVCFHLLGFSDKTWAGLTLPFDLTPLGGKGCRLNASIALIHPASISPVTRIGTFRLPIPASPTLLGGVFFHQFLVQDKKANGLGLTFSNGGKAVIGR